MIKILSCVLLLLPVLAAGQSSFIDSQKFPDKYREFDFWVGEWDVNLRQIQNDQTWADWKKSYARIYPILDGRAILELWEEKGEGPSAQKIIGYSLRYYDPEQDKWILWLNWPGVNRSGSSSLTGSFRHGRGEFFSKRPTSDSTSIISRYSFSDISSTSLRWDDAFSRDGGKTWTNDWIMEFSRASERADWANNNVAHTYRNGERCSLDQFAEVQKLAGNWIGTAQVLNQKGKWTKMKASSNNYQALGGCSVLTFLEVEQTTPYREFGLFTFNTYAQKFEDGRLSNDSESSYRSFYGDQKDGVFELAHRKQSGGKASELIRYHLKDNQLTVDKLELRNGEMVKVMTLELQK